MPALTIARDLRVSDMNVPVRVDIPQGSNDLNLRFNFVDSIPSGSAMIYIHKPSGLEIYNQATEQSFTSASCYAVFKVTTQMTAEPGYNEAQVRIVATGKVLNSFPIIFNVVESPIEGEGITSKDEFKALDDALNGIEDAIEDAETATGNANSAAQSATQASQSANTAASNANSAASSANSAASYANSAGDSISQLETQVAANESTRQTNEQSRVAAETKRVADFAVMEQRSKGWLRHYCTEGEYDPITREPIISEPNDATLYYVPVENPTEHNRWVEWQYDTEGDRWEMQGTTEVSLDPVSTDTIDSITDDNEQETGSEVLQTTGLTYLWQKIKAKFAAITHTHSASDITSGTLGVSCGGTGVTTAADERNRLGLGNTTGTLPIANGGTGAATAAAARTNLGVTAANVVDGNAIAPASVAATGSITGASIGDANGTLADLRDSVSLKTLQITRTTTASGIIGTGLTISNAIVHAVRTSTAFRCVPYVATDGAWNVIVLKAQATQEAIANASVDITVYYV